MEMLDVINDAAFCTRFGLTRSLATRERDGSIQASQTLCQMRGVVQPSRNSATEVLPEGDRTKPAISVWCGRELNPTYGDSPVLGDVLHWHGRCYRIAAIRDWSQYGYWQATAVEVRHNADG